MTRPPDDDPQRGPRRYGPTSGNDVPRPGNLPPDRRPPRPQPGPPPPAYRQPGPPPPPASRPSSPQQAPRQPPPATPRVQQPPGRQPAARPPERQAWSDLADGGPDRTAVLPPGALGFDGPGQPGGQQSLRGPVPPVPPTGRPAPRVQGQRNQGRALDPYRPVPDQEQRRRTPGVILAGRIIAAVLSVAVLAGFAFAWGFANNATSRVATGNDSAKAGQAGVLFRGGTNILLIGSDSRTDQQGNPLTAAELAAVSTQDDGGGVNTDTIMIVHIPEGGGKATAISLPRDTWIPKSVTDIVMGPYDDGTKGPYKPNKINSFYSTARFYTQQFEVGKGVKDKAQVERDADNAGRTELQAIVQAFTGLHIDHYAEVNLIGFYTLSNAIGGVPVCLNAAVNDPFSGANFKAGPQEISGSAAMSFVRQRHGLPGGDLDRVRRQQAFLAGATNKMLSAGVLGSPSKLSSLLDAAGRSVVLDSGFDLLTFAAQMADLSGGNVTFSTIPITGPEKSTNTDALATDPAQLKAFFSAINGKAATTQGTTAGSSSASTTTSTAATTFDAGTVTVDVQNATKINNLAASVSARLSAAGFVAGDVITFPGITAATAHATTTISYPTGAKTAAAAVQKALGGKGELVLDDSIASGHISVAAGKDMPAPSGLRALGLDGLAAGAVAAPPAQAAPATTTGPAPINAGTVGCVN